MNTNERDLLLVDYLDKKVTRQELLNKFPDLAMELDLINLTINALNSLPEVNTGKQMEIPVTGTVIKFNRRKYWYAAATVILIAGAAFLFVFRNGNENYKLSMLLSSNKTDEKIKALWSVFQLKSQSKSYQKKLLLLATKDNNSNIRYMALEELGEITEPLSEPELINYISQEQIFTNQTAWLELWVKLHPQPGNELQTWLNKEGINPTVKNYGLRLIKSNAKL
jgi:hypothetical protein